MAKLRQVEIAEIMDGEPRVCATCPTILEEHEQHFCRYCASYWEDVDNGLFDDDWGIRGPTAALARLIAEAK